MRLFVTGANGFIGGRVVELFHDDVAWTVRAGVRRVPPGARLAATPVDVVACDIMRPPDLGKALNDVDAVVHCAQGPGPVTVQGTRNVLDAALAGGLQRVIHLSTIDVYGPVTGEVDEDTPLQSVGAEYGDAKVKAEAVCREFMERGLDVVILRPTIVHGPFSDRWTLEFVERLQARPWPFPAEVSRGTCNLLYVDDLVEAIRLALTEPAAVGEAFNVNGPDRPTWYEYFSALNHRLGLPPLEGPGAPPPSPFRSALMTPLRALAKFGFRNFRGVVEMLQERSSLARKAMTAAESRLRSVPNASELDLYGRRVSFSTEKASSLLGYHPDFDMERALTRTMEWLASDTDLAPRTRPEAGR